MRVMRLAPKKAIRHSLLHNADRMEGRKDKPFYMFLTCARIYRSPLRYSCACVFILHALPAFCAAVAFASLRFAVAFHFSTVFIFIAAANFLFIFLVHFIYWFHFKTLSRYLFSTFSHNFCRGFSFRFLS